MNEIDYIADFSVPNKSAYAVHVFKICDSFVKQKYKLNLYLYSNENTVSFRKIKKDYNLKNNYKVHYCFKKKRNRNIFNNLLFAFWLKKKINIKSFVLSRSIIPALLLKLFGFKIILEVHHEMSGLTKNIFNLLSKFKPINNLDYIFIHENLKKKFNKKTNKCVILDDGVELNDFKLSARTKKNCVYTGGFAPGKGLEFFAELAKNNPKTNFYAYGNASKYNYKIFYRNIKNLKFMNYVFYNKIPRVLKSNLILLMPYRRQIGILAKNISVENYISPLKLFEYLASSNLIIASKLSVYAHILKHKYNCFLCNPDNIEEWNHYINKILETPNKFSSIKKNAFNTAKKFTWDNRAKNILKFFIERFQK